MVLSVLCSRVEHGKYPVAANRLMCNDAGELGIAERKDVRRKNHRIIERDAELHVQEV